MTEQTNHGSDIYLRRWLSVFIRYSWLVILGAVVGGLVAWFLSTDPPTVFRATTKILVQEGSGSAGRTAGDISLSRELTATYATLITTQPVLETAGERLGLTAQTVRSRIAVGGVQQTPIITITARDSNSARAAEIANEVAVAFIDNTRTSRLAEIAQFQQAAFAQGLSNVDALTSLQLAGLNSLRVIEVALPPPSPVSTTGGSTDIYLGGAAGLAIAVMIVLIAEFLLFDIIRSKERFEELFSAPVLSVLPYEDIVPEIFGETPAEVNFAEGIRLLRANLLFAPRNGNDNQIMITSAEPGAGKSTVLSHLAYALAATGKSVIILDADLRRPSLAAGLLGASDRKGLSNFLADDSVTLEDILVQTPMPTLSVIPSGPIPRSPSELLGVSRMRVLLDQMTERTDFILVDSPPLFAAADALIIAGQIRNVLLVVDSPITRVRAIRQVFESMERVEGKIIGAIVNKHKVSRLSFYYNRYYGNYYGDYYAQHLEEKTNGVPANSAWPSRIRSRLKRGGRKVKSK